jgi:hypothetical protein
MTEEWKKIPGYIKYSVSSNGKVRNDVTGRILVLTPNPSGYLKVGLYTKRWLVHRLVMLAFVGPSKMQVDHIDEVKTNNRLDNLRYLSGRLNTRRSVSKDDNYNIKFRDNRYQINISVKGKLTYFGCFKTLEEAKVKRDKVLNKLALTDK